MIETPRGGGQQVVLSSSGRRGEGLLIFAALLYLPCIMHGKLATQSCS